MFYCQHETGAHWTYARVPYDEWWRALTGVALNSQLGLTRNHFDRLVHFPCGFLTAYPIREGFSRVGQERVRVLRRAGLVHLMSVEISPFRMALHRTPRPEKTDADARQPRVRSLSY